MGTTTLLQNNRFLISTPEGFKNFSGVAQTLHNSYLQILLTPQKTINCTKKHRLFTSLHTFMNAEGLMVGDTIRTKTGLATIVDIIEKNESRYFYDLLDVESSDSSFFLENDIVSHNCQFLAFEKTLIEPDVLDFYPIPEGFLEFGDFKAFRTKLEHPDSILIITIDPSGGGEDSSVIQIWEIAPARVSQLMVGSDPTWSATDIFNQILWLQDFFKRELKYEPSDALILFERNGVGEALSNILTQTEKAIEELEFPIYYDNKGKAGIHLGQTLKNKLALQFKNLFEHQKLIVYDHDMIGELYGFIRTAGGSYAGKTGYNDDRVMCAFYAVFYVMNVFSDYASGDFSVDTLMLVSKEDKIQVIKDVDTDPAEAYRVRQSEAKRLKEEEERQKLINEQLAAQARLGSSVIEPDQDNDDDLWDTYDMFPVVV